MTWMKQLKQSLPTLNRPTTKPFHLLLQEKGFKCVEDVYYGEGLKLWCIGNGVWRIEKENEHA